MFSNKYRFYWLFMALLFVSFGCSQKKVFEEYKKFDKLSWYRFDILEFEVPVQNIETSYDIYIQLRHLPEFPHKQLPINFTIYSPTGEMRSADQLLELNDKEGNSLSKCLGDFCDVSIMVREGITFYEPGIYKFIIENKWKKVDLPGIMEVGLLIKKTN